MKVSNWVKSTGVVLGILSAVPSIWANTGTFINSDAFSYSSGGVTAGEFNITGAAASAFDQYYNQSSSVDVIMNGGFETFCTETGVDVQLGSSHSYNFGLGQSTVGVGTGANEALSSGAAWLYEQFALGTLSGYDYANTLTGNQSRNYEAGQLQAAIWYFQGQTMSGWPSPTNNNPFYTDAIGRFGTFNAAEAAENNAFDVSILILTNSSGGISQNQLVLTGTPTSNVSAPDSTATLLLMGLGMAALALAGSTRQLAPIRVRRDRR